jgi:hypothetical protein
MQEPDEKKIGAFGNDLLVEAVRMKLRWYEGTRIDEPCSCPDCGEDNYRKHDFEDRIFAILITEDGFEKIRIEYRRFWCKTCKQTFSTDLSEYFYEDCRYGKPIVNLCLQLAAKMPPTQVEKQLQQIGIQVDRDTVSRYVELFGENFAEQHGITVAGEPLAQNVLAALFDVDTVENLKDEYAEELTEADFTEVTGCADETYPEKKGAKKELYEENMERKQEEKNPRPHPDGFTVGCGYLPELDCYASVQCRNTAFASVLADALGLPLEGVSYCVTDDEDCYNGTFEDRLKCLFHRQSNRAREDERVEQLHKEGKHEQLAEYLEQEYETAYQEEIERLKEDYPSFWDEKAEKFIGPVTTNAVESGNWRLKRALRVPYQQAETARGRLLLGALSDSLYTYRNGQPEVSFAQRHGTFSFEEIMQQETGLYHDRSVHPPAPPVKSMIA